MATLTLGFPSHGTFFAPDELHRAVELAALAEEAGVDRIIVPDHVVMGAHADRYPWGDFPYPPEVPWLEPLTLLAACATATSRVRLCTGVLIAPLRPAILLAKTAATIDVLSQGRLDLGVGTGWQREELDAAGVSYENRGRILTDTIGACRALWGDQPAAFTSDTVSFDELWCAPAPVQPGGPKVLFSGSLTARNLDRIVRLGDGWIPIMGTSTEQLRVDVERLRAAWDEAGRGPEGPEVLGRLAPLRDDAGTVDVARTVDKGAAEVIAAGATSLQLSLMGLCSSMAEAPAVLDQLAPAIDRLR